MKINLLASQIKALVIIICTASFIFSQSIKAPTTKGELSQTALTSERDLLINELQFLDRESGKFNDPLAEALAKVEIADAAWQFDRNWAKKLLRRAFEITLPAAEQKQDRPAGSIPPMPNATDRSRQKVRHRILEIARRNKEFADELIKLEAERLGAYEKQFTLAVLADQSLEGGDVKASADYILQGIEADPTQGAAPGVINEVALRDRMLADRLILHYIGELRKFPISPANQSDIRIFVILSSLMKPRLSFDPSNPERVKVPPPSAEVMRTYVSYMLDAFNILEQKEPGYLQMRRRLLLSLWIPLQQYAPDLSGSFLNLEGRSRSPGEKLTLPTVASTEEEARSGYERRIKDGLKGNQPSEAVIYMAVSKGDFDNARKMIDKLPDNAQKKQLSDIVNAEEAVSLAAQDKLYEAETLAGKLSRADSILKVYPVLIGKCAAKKDQPCAVRLIYQALKQVKISDTSLSLPPEGIPASAVASDQRFDPVLSFIAKLAIELVRYDTDLAFEVVNELVLAANARPLDADQAHTIFDVNVFKKLAPKDEARVEQTAYSLKNPVQRVLALAALYQWKSKELSEQLSKFAKTN